MRKLRKYVPNKRTRLNPRKNFNETHITNLSDKEFEGMVIKMHRELRGTVDELTENFNKETENTRKYQTEVTEMKNTVTELKTYTRQVHIYWNISKPTEV